MEIGNAALGSRILIPNPCWNQITFTPAPHSPDLFIHSFLLAAAVDFIKLASFIATSLQSNYTSQLALIENRRCSLRHRLPQLNDAIARAP